MSANCRWSARSPSRCSSPSIFWSIFGTHPARRRRHQAAGAELPQPARRGGLSQGTGLWRGPRTTGPIRSTVRELFANVRRNYFRLYFHYAYFNIFRGLYIQADNIFAYLILIPTIVAGKITFGILQQILTAFGQVSNSFQYLVNSWTTIIELLSIHKRLRAFEAQFEGKRQAPIESPANVA